ncbi:hypothetical protein KUV57_11750 [Epibacterium sp. DP7N7-1]|nr:hypothetical protein [Epibacterium sp. DP7N7-1]
MKQSEAFPFEYRGRIYKSKHSFLNDAAWELLQLRSPHVRRPFGVSEWETLSPESHMIAKRRRWLYLIIGRVNCVLGFNVPGRVNRQVTKPSGEWAFAPRSERPSIVPKSKQTPNALLGRDSSARKYPLNGAQLIEHMVNLVDDLRDEEGRPVTSVNMWRKLHSGSQRAAQAAGIVKDVADRLGLEYRQHKTRKD